MTRRTLLETAAAALTGSVTAAQNAKRVRFGVRAPVPNTTLRERAQLVKSLGYDGIELGPEWLRQAVEAIQKELDGVGLPVSAIVGSLKLLDPDPVKRGEAVALDRQRLQMAKELGADCVIEVPVFGPNQYQDLSPVMTPREIEDKLLTAGLKALAPDVARTGVTLLLEPLTKKETHYMNLQSHGAGIIKAVGAPGFKLLSDFYHMQMEETDIGQTLTQYGNHTAYVHLADGEKRTEAGSLPFDYRPGFRALKKWKFSGWLTMEAKATDNPEGALKRALAYIQKQWAEA